MSKFISDDCPDNPFAFIQWKGTDVCMDFYCECGAHCHFDGAFAYAVKCRHCETIWEMPVYVIPRKADDRTYPAHVTMAANLEPDEDHSTKQVGADGVERLIPHPVNY